jgi:uncharacterized membrane protein
MMYYWGNGFMIPGLGLIFVLVLIFGAVYMFRGESLNCCSKESAMDLLDKRLAKGEINEKEYSRLKKTIQK